MTGRASRVWLEVPVQQQFCTAVLVAALMAVFQDVAYRHLAAQRKALSPACLEITVGFAEGVAQSTEFQVGGRVVEKQQQTGPCPGAERMVLFTPPGGLELSV